MALSAPHSRGSLPPPPLSCAAGSLIAPSSSLRTQVMVEVRDARLPLSCRHPAFDGWAAKGGRTTLLVYTHADLLSVDEVPRLYSPIQSTSQQQNTCTPGATPRCRVYAVLKLLK